MTKEEFLKKISERIAKNKKIREHFRELIKKAKAANK